MRKSNWLKVFLLSMLVLSLAVGCASTETDGGNDTPQGNDAEGDGAVHTQDQELVIAVNENFISMDPHNSGDTNSNSVQSAMLEGLLGTDENGQITPLLAKDYTISDDALVYTFQLQEGVVFHDGTPFNAEAVKVNFERAMNDTGLRLYNRGFNLITSVDVLDEYTVRVTLQEPFSGMLTRFVSARIISPAALSDDSIDITRTPVGTGPFKFVEWVPGDHLTVERLDDYWREKERVKRIVYKPVPENGARVAMLKTGEAHVIYPLPVQNLDELENDSQVDVHIIPSTIARYVSLNTTKGPLQDVRVRQALNYAIDNDAFIQVVRAGYGTPLDSIIPRITLHYEQQELYAQNIEKAKALLEEAGYGDGFQIEIWGNTNSDTLRGMQFVQQQLRNIGVDVDIKSMEEGVLSEEIYGPQTPEESKVHMWYVSWAAFASDTSHAIRPLFHSASFPPNGANTAYYHNEEVDRLINEANESVDRHKQAEIFSQIQSTIYQDAPWIFLGVDDIVAGMRSNVSGIYITPTGAIDVTDANLK